MDEHQPLDDQERWYDEDVAAQKVPRGTIQVTWPAMILAFGIAVTLLLGICVEISHIAHWLKIL